jgi:hypothetical protein
MKLIQGTLTEGEGVTVGLMIKVTCFVIEVDNIFNIKMSRSKQYEPASRTVSWPGVGVVPVRDV